MPDALKSFPRVCIPLLFCFAAAHAQSGLRISQVTDNRGAYAGSQVPKFEKLEITFQVENSVAQNLQMPFDSAPPAGVPAGLGITVNAEFTPNNWQTVYTQPAFYFQEFLDELRGSREWFYPTGAYSWKVRFAPPSAGTWQYRLRAQDAGGSTVTANYSFSVAASSNRGFLRVSPRDPRYFEFEDGTWFPALGYNMNYDHVSWFNPTLDNRPNFQAMAANGIQLVRIWLSQWSIHGSEWNPWNSQDPAEASGYLPSTGINYGEVYPGSDFSMRVAADRNKCMFIGVWKAKPAVKRNTNYRVRIRYKTRDMGGPIDAGRPYGFVAKTGDWLWSDNVAQRCYSPGTGTLVTPHRNQNTAGWEILEGSLNSGSADFLPNFFLVMENISAGTTFVDYVWIEEILGGGAYGPNIVSKPWMAHHWYFEQRNSYAFDKVLDLAKANGVYLRPVIHEKNDRILSRIDFNGNPVLDVNNDLFYGNWRQMTKVRWLQRAWWRYLQARWGYSQNIHSWELLNEGDPWSGRHYTLADELGKYMHQFANRHMVSTSMWHSFPGADFWKSSSYPDVDFADIHLYVPKDAGYATSIDRTNFQVGTAAGYPDTAAASKNISDLVGALRPRGAGKPVIRGETGFTVSGTEPADPDLLADRTGIWLHNFIWAGINAGGLIESYWYDTVHIYGRNNDGVDLRYRFKSYFDFIRNLPLNAGGYEDAAADVSHPLLRAWGQKDAANGRAHLWIHNVQNTWRIATSGVTPQPATGTVTLTGFRPSAVYSVEWWDTHAGAVIRTDSVLSGSNGNIALQVSNLAADTAVRITGSESDVPSPPRNLRIAP